MRRLPLASYHRPQLTATINRLYADTTTRLEGALAAVCGDFRPAHYTKARRSLGAPLGLHASQLGRWGVTRAACLRPPPPDACRCWRDTCFWATWRRWVEADSSSSGRAGQEHALIGACRAWHRSVQPPAPALLAARLSLPYPLPLARLQLGKEVQSAFIATVSTSATKVGPWPEWQGWLPARRS